MAGRKRTDVINSSEELRAALIRNRGNAAESVLQLLLHIKEHPARNIKEIAKDFSLSERTIYRWLKDYRENGLERVLAKRKTDLLPNQEQLFFSDDSDVAADINTALATTTQGVSHQVISFLNKLPLTTDTVTWCRAFKQLLCEFLDDVDRVVINIRTTLDMLNPASNRPGQIHRQSFFSHKRNMTEVSVLHDTDQKQKWEQIFEEGIQNDFPAHLYHTPIGFDYFYQTSGSYLGTIILFSKQENQPISSQTITLMEELRPFFLYILSDHIARHRMKNPGDVLFRDLVSRINHDANLSSREQEILMLLLLAYSYDEIATHLFISVKTVDTHIQSIYRKVGAQNLKEIFARYLTPRLSFMKRSVR